MHEFIYCNKKAAKNNRHDIWEASSVANLKPEELTQFNSNSFRSLILWAKFNSIVCCTRGLWCDSSILSLALRDGDYCKVNSLNNFNQSILATIFLNHFRYCNGSLSSHLMVMCFLLLIFTFFFSYISHVFLWPFLSLSPSSFNSSTLNFPFIFSCLIHNIV